MGDVVIIPSPSRSDGYAELAAETDQVTGRKYPRFRKHLLTLGELNYQGRTYNLDEGWYARLKDNFNSGVSMVQVPLANDQNKHTENPLANTGEVVGIEREGNKVYSVIEVRKPGVAQGIRDRTIMGASAFLSMDYTDTRTQKKVGPALLHHCLTNRPYVLDLEPYQEIVAASVDMEEEPVVVLAAPEEPMPTKEELLLTLKNEHGIDVAALEAQAAAKADTAALTSAVTEALKGSGVQLSAGQDGSVTMTDVTGAIAELALSNQTLTTHVAELKQDAAERDVDALINAGRLLPKSRSVAIQMALSNPGDLDSIVAPVDSPYVRLSHTEGRPAPDGEQKHVEDIDAELARLTAENPTLFTKDGK
jgi:hypothetical protein